MTTTPPATRPRPFRYHVTILLGGAIFATSIHGVQGRAGILSGIGQFFGDVVDDLAGKIEDVLGIEPPPASEAQVIGGFSRVQIVLLGGAGGEAGRDDPQDGVPEIRGGDGDEQDVQIFPPPMARVGDYAQLGLISAKKPWAQKHPRGLDLKATFSAASSLEDSSATLLTENSGKFSFKEDPHLAAARRVREKREAGEDHSESSPDGTTKKTDENTSGCWGWVRALTKPLGFCQQDAGTGAAVGDEVSVGKHKHSALEIAETKDRAEGKAPAGKTHALAIMTPKEVRCSLFGKGSADPATLAAFDWMRAESAMELNEGVALTQESVQKELRGGRSPFRGGGRGLGRGVSERGFTALGDGGYHDQGDSRGQGDTCPLATPLTTFARMRLVAQHGPKILGQTDVIAQPGLWPTCPDKHFMCTTGDYFNRKNNPPTTRVYLADCPRSLSVKLGLASSPASDGKPVDPKPPLILPVKQIVDRFELLLRRLNRRPDFVTVYNIPVVKEIRCHLSGDERNMLLNVFGDSDSAMDGNSLFRDHELGSLDFTDSLKCTDGLGVLPSKAMVQVFLRLPLMVLNQDWFLSELRDRHAALSVGGDIKVLCAFFTENVERHVVR